MQVQAIQGYFDNGAFFQQGRRVSLPERKVVIVNVLDVPVDMDETKKADIEFWKAFDNRVRESVDEELMMVDFPRCDLGHKLITFDDGE
jgi:hypothetical protein